MSKIEDLVAEKCPNGVEYKRVSDVCDILRGKRLTKSQLTEEKTADNKYPVLHGGMEPMGYYFEPNRKAGTTIVINTGNAGNVYYSFEEYWSSDACFSLYPKDNIVLDRYLYFFMATKEDVLHGKIRSGAMPTIDALAVESLEIPVPPLDIQKEIVSVLDSFTELEAELEARRKQYEHYREQLLSFENLSAEGGGKLSCSRLESLLRLSEAAASRKKTTRRTVFLAFIMAKYMFTIKHWSEA